MNSESVIESIRTLHDVSKAVNSALDVALVEDMILRKTSLLMRSDKVLILLLDKEKKVLSIHNSLGFKPSELPPHQFADVRSFDHCIVHKGNVITLGEVLSSKDLRLLEHDWPHLFRMIFAPLEIQGEAYGLLGTIGHAKSYSEIDLEIFCSLGSQAAMAMENASLYERLHSAFLGTVEALAEAVGSRDPYTGGHAKRVQDQAVRLAREMALSEEEIETLRLSAILHDIGKIGIDDAILRKSGKLTEEEKRQMNEHPRIGAKILSSAEEMAVVVPGVLHHHEWYDGSGYPDGLKGLAIPLHARIIAIVDAFDALTTNRPYRQALPVNKTLDVLDLHSGSHFDPDLLKIFRLLQHPSS